MSKNKVAISPKFAERMKAVEAARARAASKVEADYAREMESLEAANQQHTKQLEDDHKNKGLAYTEFVNELGELLGVPRSALVERRNKRTGEVIAIKGRKPQMVDPDLNGEEHVAKLQQAIQSLLSKVATREEARAQQPVNPAPASTPNPAPTPTPVSMPSASTGPQSQHVQPGGDRVPYNAGGTPSSVHG